MIYVFCYDLLDFQHTQGMENLYCIYDTGYIGAIAFTGMCGLHIVSAIEKGQCPDWNTALGGAIMIHGCGSSSDWTAGCVAVDNDVMDLLFDYCPIGTKITILP